MKIFISGLLLCLSVSEIFSQTQPAFNDTATLQNVELNATRATDKTPVAKTTLSKSEIEKMNVGQDLPFILQQTASVVVNSDAGNGIGYTGIRIRGTDASRINVTINGIPYNDAESQGAFFVDLPDIASSSSSIQIQRGVGSSTNGAAAFGGSININTNEIVRQRKIQYASNAGSYSSFRNSLNFNSGILQKHFTLDARLSDIRSKGYIERAATKLQSFYTSAAYLTDKHHLRLNIFSGKEKTYQAWNGVDVTMLKTNRRFNSAGTEKPDEPYNDETDNYTQTHFNLTLNSKLSNFIKGNVTAFLTRGKGYYQQYKAAASFASYGLPDVTDGVDTLSATDLIRRLWLDNYFYGTVFSGQYEREKTTVIVGGNVNRYDGKHYGEIVFATVPEAIPKNFRWYDVNADKTDFSSFVKWMQQVSENWQTFVDVQFRAINYNLFGFRNNPLITVQNNYFFFNPKAGITYTRNNIMAYASYARASKEPNRDDFETGVDQTPSPEYLNDFEAGFEHRAETGKWGLGFYFMKYRDQLVLTGKINDVGAYTRTNIEKSHRAGVELTGAKKILKCLDATGTLAVSRNTVKDFQEYIDDYDNGGQIVKTYKKSALAFSPELVGSASVTIRPFRNATIDLFSKYVGKQFLDNTSNENRKLSGFYVQDIRLGYNLNLRRNGTVLFYIQGNNVFSKLYEPNGYSFSYFYGGEMTTENYYFPMAPFNVMGGLTIKL